MVRKTFCCVPTVWATFLYLAYIDRRTSAATPCSASAAVGLQPPRKSMRQDRGLGRSAPVRPLTCSQSSRSFGCMTKRLQCDRSADTKTAEPGQIKSGCSRSLHLAVAEMCDGTGGKYGRGSHRGTDRIVMVERQDRSRGPVRRPGIVLAVNSALSRSRMGGTILTPTGARHPCLPWSDEIGPGCLLAKELFTCRPSASLSLSDARSLSSQPTWPLV